MQINLLKNWEVQFDCGKHTIVGNIYNDSKNRFTDGKIIYTSRLLNIDFVNNTATTKNTTYNLEVLYNG